MNGDISGPYKALVTECYLFNEKGTNKHVYEEAFIEAYRSSLSTMDSLEKILKSSGTDW